MKVLTSKSEYPNPTLVFECPPQTQVQGSWFEGMSRGSLFFSGCPTVPYYSPISPVGPGSS